LFIKCQAAKYSYDLCSYDKKSSRLERTQKAEEQNPSCSNTKSTRDLVVSFGCKVCRKAHAQNHNKPRTNTIYSFFVHCLAFVVGNSVLTNHRQEEKRGEPRLEIDRNVGAEKRVNTPHRKDGHEDDKQNDDRNQE